MENVLSQRRRIRERVKCFQKVCYVVLGGKKNGDGKGKKIVGEKNVTNAVGKTKEHISRGIGHHTMTKVRGNMHLLSKCFIPTLFTIYVGHLQVVLLHGIFRRRPRRALLTSGNLKVHTLVGGKLLRSKFGRKRFFATFDVSAASISRPLCLFLSCRRSQARSRRS